MKIKIIAPRGVIYHGKRVRKGEVIDLQPTDKKHADVWIGSGQAEAFVEEKPKAK